MKVLSLTKSASYMTGYDITVKQTFCNKLCAEFIQDVLYSLLYQYSEYCDAVLIQSLQH